MRVAADQRSSQKGAPTTSPPLTHLHLCQIPFWSARGRIAPGRWRRRCQPQNETGHYASDHHDGRGCAGILDGLICDKVRPDAVAARIEELAGINAAYEAMRRMRAPDGRLPFSGHAGRQDSCTIVPSSPLKVYRRTARGNARTGLGGVSSASTMRARSRHQSARTGQTARTCDRNGVRHIGRPHVRRAGTRAGRTRAAA
jgi:hypothetical protein